MPPARRGGRTVAKKVASWARSTTPNEATSILAPCPRLRQALRRWRAPDRGPAPGPLALRPAPDDDLALPARPHGLRDRRPLRVRPAHGSPLDRPGRWLYHIAERANSATFIEFLGQILDAYPKAPVIAIVLDN